MMIDTTILAATSLSSDNPAALVALALIELFLAEPTDAFSQSKLVELIDKWTQTHVGADPVAVNILIAQLKDSRASSETLTGTIKQAS